MKSSPVLCFPLHATTLNYIKLIANFPVPY
nr:MAG TPA: hypothetical protein [Caudoviricetes sp.]